MGPCTWLAAYPRSGTTWARTLVQELVDDAGEHPDVAAGSVLATHKTYDGHVARYGADMIGFVHVVRHPVDVLLGEAARFGRSQTPDVGTNVPLDQDQLDGIVLDYLERLELEGPDAPQHRLGMGSWGEHTMAWLDAREAHPHLLLRYEDLAADPTGELRRIAGFLRVEFSDEAIADIVHRRSPSWIEGVQAPLVRTAIGETADLGWHAREQVAARYGEAMGRLGYSIDHDQPVVPLPVALRTSVPVPELSAVS